MLPEKKEPAAETSGLVSWSNPPGFQDAAVASSATLIKAPPIPMALAPEPTGLGVADIVMSGACANEVNGCMITHPKKRQIMIIRMNIVTGYSILGFIVFSPVKGIDKAFTLFDSGMQSQGVG